MLINIDVVQKRTQKPEVSLTHTSWLIVVSPAVGNNSAGGVRTASSQGGRKLKGVRIARADDGVTQV